MDWPFFVSFYCLIYFENIFLIFKNQFQDLSMFVEVMIHWENADISYEQVVIFIYYII